MSVIAGEALKYIETPGGNAGVGIATPSRGAKEVSIIRQRQEPGGFNPFHTHDREEVLTMISGRITISVQDDPHSLAEGDTIVIPPGTPHQITNTSTETAEWLLIAPAGVRFFRDSGEEATPPWAQ